MKKKPKPNLDSTKKELFEIVESEELKAIAEFERSEQEVRAELESADGELAARAQQLLSDLEQARRDFLEKVNAVKRPR